MCRWIQYQFLLQLGTSSQKGEIQMCNTAKCKSMQSFNHSYFSGLLSHRTHKEKCFFLYFISLFFLYTNKFSIFLFIFDHWFIPFMHLYSIFLLAPLICTLRFSLSHALIAHHIDLYVICKWKSTRPSCVFHPAHFPSPMDTLSQVVEVNYSERLPSTLLLCIKASVNTGNTV